MKDHSKPFKAGITKVNVIPVIITIAVILFIKMYIGFFVAIHNNFHQILLKSPLTPILIILPLIFLN